MLAIHGFFQEAVEQRALITSEEGSPVQFGDVDYKVHGLDFVFAGKDTRFSEHQQQIQCQELSESCVWWTKRIRCYLSSKK